MQSKKRRDLFEIEEIANTQRRTTTTKATTVSMITTTTIATTTIHKYNIKKSKCGNKFANRSWQFQLLVCENVHARMCVCVCLCEKLLQVQLLNNTGPRHF